MRICKGAALADLHLHDARLIRMRKWAARAETLHPALSASVAAADDVTSPTRRLAPAQRNRLKEFFVLAGPINARASAHHRRREWKSKNKSVWTYIHTPGLLASRNKASGNAPHKKPPQTPGRGRMTYQIFAWHPSRGNSRRHCYLRDILILGVE